MSWLEFLNEIIGHCMAAAAFFSVVWFVAVYHRSLKRRIRKAFLLYWLILSAGVLFGVLNIVSIIALIVRGSHAQIATLDLFSEYFGSLVQSLIIILLIGMRIVTEKGLDRPRRILVIGAHPDDIEISCGATMARYHDSGHLVWGLIMTRGEQGGDCRARPGEARRGAEFLGLDQVRLEGFPDTRLHEKSVEIIQAIEGVIREFQPDVIFTHSGHDQHQDHRTVFESTLRAARNQSTILCYESPSATQDFAPTVFVAADEYLDVKVQSVKEHWDQHDKSYVQPERIKGNAVFRGGQGKLRYAEGFEIVRADLSKLG